MDYNKEINMKYLFVLLISLVFISLSFSPNLIVYTDSPNYIIHVSPNNLTQKMESTKVTLTLPQGTYNISVINTLTNETHNYHVLLYTDKDLWVNEKEKTLEGIIFLFLGIGLIFFIINKLKLRASEEASLSNDERAVLDILREVKEIERSALELKLDWHSSKLKLILSELELLGYITKEKKGNDVIIRLREQKENVEMKEKKKRGQASIEYLMTYGWAILVLSIVIVVLFAGGFLSPEGTVKEYCLFPPQIGCNAFISYYWHGNVIFKMNITNNLGYDAKITKVIVKYKSTKIERQVNEDIEQGESKVFSFMFSSVKPPPSRLAKYEVTIYYEPCPIEFKNCGDEYKIKGSVLSYVQPEEK